MDPLDIFGLTFKDADEALPLVISRERQRLSKKQSYSDCDILRAIKKYNRLYFLIYHKNKVIIFFHIYEKII
tara:strand:+ start:303 stop:518 length:216 start_codon:yes stop_codon:yes gene_type:complete